MIRHNLNLKNQKLSNISLVLIKFRLYYMHVVKFRKSQKQSLIQFFQQWTEKSYPNLRVLLLLETLHLTFSRPQHWTTGPTTDKETDESWDIFYNMKNQFSAGLGSRASSVKKKVWADYEQLLRSLFFMFSWAKIILKTLH